MDYCACKTDKVKVLQFVEIYKKYIKKLKDHHCSNTHQFNVKQNEKKEKV